MADISAPNTTISEYVEEWSRAAAVAASLMRSLDAGETAQQWAALRYEWKPLWTDKEVSK